jgi:3-phenylpropionate/trans-cinnamate dioxygenase ferredoxin reductase subunit
VTAPIVILGAGTAGSRAADALRKLGHDGPVLLIGEEPYPPYQRPPLSKKFLLGAMSEDQLWLQGEGFFAQQGITLMTGARAAAIEPRLKRITLTSGAEIAYHKLILATGSRARALPIPGAQLAGVNMLRGIDDVARLRAALPEAQRIAIIGGGYIGLEVCAVLREMGKPVTVIESEERLLKRVMSPLMAEYFGALHLRHGAEILLGRRVTRLVGEGHVAGVELADGAALPADLVLAAIGGAANDELAREAGIPCQDGILVDGHCEAAPDIYAAGDCARFPSRRYGRMVRLESVQNASDQGRAAAQSALGQGEAYDPVPWFWSDQYDVKLQIAGLAQGFDRHTADGDMARGSFSVSYYQGERLLAVDAVNAPRAHMLARRALGQMQPL